SDDPEVTCYALLSRWKREDTAVLERFKAFWSAPRELPDGCLQLARAVSKAGQLGSPEVWARFRTLIDAGLIGAAKRSMEFLPRAEAIDPRRLAPIVRSPARFLKNPTFDLAKVSDRELLIAAMTLAADSEPVAVAKLWSGGVGAKFSPPD